MYVTNMFSLEELPILQKEKQSINLEIKLK